MIKKTLYFGNSAYLSLKNRQMVIQLPKEMEGELPCDDTNNSINI